MSSTPISVYLKLVCVALFWGGTFIAGRIVSTEVPHMIAAAGRFLVACVFLLLLAWKVEGGLPKLTRQQVHATFGLGATGIFLYNLCFLAALQRMPAGRSALFVSLSPIVTALSMAVLFRERLGLTKWFGIAIAFFGAAIVLTRGDLYQVVHDISATMGSGELFMLAAVGSWTTYTILGKHALQGLSPIAATTYASLWGLLLLSMGAVMQLPQLDATKLSCASPQLHRLFGHLRHRHRLCLVLRRGQGNWARTNCSFQQFGARVWCWIERFDARGTDLDFDGGGRFTRHCRRHDYQ